ncbi:hypothetical protein D6X88_10705 [Listeria monocytogenes]|nr:hypothetical protein [Listeria monocytogenes]EAD5399873.1 hypothetical protein [Listeria monocytogenes serotype 4b]EAF4534477.1 hypothetical protein [Listeria monocytogenes serotype 1/2a]EAH4412163.1 hypothetical protein [Listeria monocytogenes serotype 1/2b]KAH0822928.1 hypothetical protein CFSAN002349_202576 [Listeria monocytogenes CFSAN002349]RKF90603.1 hypothetical protein CFSAN002345_002683 [Listeria monocytogenes CFSAN002345]
MDGEQTIESLEVEEIVYEQIIRTKEGYTNTGKFIFTKMKMMLVAKRFLVKKYYRRSTGASNSTSIGIAKKAGTFFLKRL